MRNKKILNICLLSFGLLTLFTFILPISKFAFVGEESGFIKVMFYLFNSILILSLVALVVFAIINLFQDNYKYVKVMEIMALLGLIMVFMVVLIFACSSYAQIKIGYLLVALEMFACANFSQMARLINSSKEFKSGFTPKKCSTQTNKNNNQQNAEVKLEHESSGAGAKLNN
ncbi:MAG: hypothetical protein IJE91_00990 [Clostridia bacterium]|nr:hypothetical protein [Clostridia bacterium]